MMPYDTLRLAVETAQAAAREDIVTCSALPTGRYYLRGEDGKLALTEAPRGSRHYVVDDLDDYAAAVEAFGEPGSTVVFCGETSIATLLNVQATRPDRLLFDLGYTSEFSLLQTLAKDRDGWSHSNFLKMLRIDLTQCAPGSVIERLRSLKFGKASSGEAKIKAGDEAISQEIRRSVVLSDGEVPESIVVDVRVYDQLPDTHKVACCIDLDLEAVEFRLIPQSGELETACYDVRRRVRDALREALGDHATVYCGQPQA